MSDSYIQQLFAERIGGAQYGKSTAIYKFEKIKRAKKAASLAKPDVALIDMGVGEPDEMAFPVVVEALQKAAAQAENRGYADNGGDRFKQAAARYMQTVFQVESVEWETDVIHSIGSKSALSILPRLFYQPWRLCFNDGAGLSCAGTHASYLGGSVYNMPLTAENEFLPDLKAIPEDVLSKAKILVLNYPNNPTGASATRAFFEQAVAFARAHDLIIVQDAAYASLIFEGQPLSILQIPGAKDVAVELHSLSKSYNMTGWRIGFVVGNPLIVKLTVI